MCIIYVNVLLLAIKYNYSIMFHSLYIDVTLPLFQDNMVCILLQVDKDLRHPLLLEQPSLQAAISTWHTDFELQEIFRKGKT